MVSEMSSLTLAAIMRLTAGTPTQNQKLASSRNLWVADTVEWRRGALPPVTHL